VGIERPLLVRQRSLSRDATHPTISAPVPP